jgi:hypothetical protein
MVGQLPIRRFPEAPPEHYSADYDMLRPYLSTNDLRFTYGGMKWRESEWQQRLRDLSGRDLVEAFVAVGSEAILIDRWGYADNAAAIEGELTEVLGEPPRVSADGRWSSFRLDTVADVADAATLAALRQHLLSDPQLALPECLPWEGTSDDAIAWCEADGVMTIVTPMPTGRPTEVSFDVATPGGDDVLELAVDGGGTQEIAVGPEPTRVRVEVPAGEDFVLVTWATDAPSIDPPTDDQVVRISAVRP